MDHEEAVEPQEPMNEMMNQVEPDSDSSEGTDTGEQTHKKTMIPLSVAQKLREQKRELELELQWERQRNSVMPQQPPEEDNSRYESATREDLRTSQGEAIRMIEEKLWSKQNPEKYERVIEHLPQFLKQRPNLASAINLASNRYEEAYMLMDALTPKQQAQLAKNAAPRKEAPNSPGGVPKAAALNEAVDVMGMTDSEFAAWRNAKKRSR